MAQYPILRHESIDSRNAALPTTYEKARTAIAVCDRLDECQDWADKAAALASYARQANDDVLVRMAQRIQLRAVRRCGELLKAIAPRETSPGRPPENRAATVPISRAQAASDAGLSDRQRKTALRVAAIPEPEFERAIETEHVTVTEMAERGTKKAPVAYYTPMNSTVTALKSSASKGASMNCPTCGLPIMGALTCMKCLHRKARDGILEQQVALLPRVFTGGLNLKLVQPGRHGLFHLQLFNARAATFCGENVCCTKPTQVAWADFPKHRSTVCPDCLNSLDSLIARAQDDSSGV